VQLCKCNNCYNDIFCFSRRIYDNKNSDPLCRCERNHSNRTVDLKIGHHDDSFNQDSLTAYNFFFLSENDKFRSYRSMEIVSNRRRNTTIILDMYIRSRFCCILCV